MSIIIKPFKKAWRKLKTLCNAVSVARLGGLLPNWVVLNLIVRVNIGLGEWEKLGLIWGQFGGF